MAVQPVLLHGLFTLLVTSFIFDYFDDIDEEMAVQPVLLYGFVYSIEMAVQPV
jgi:hypothetical protein